MNYRGLVLILLLASQTLVAQEKKMNYEAELSAQVSTKSNLPFWMATNKYGIVPDENSGLIRYKMFITPDTTKKINFDFGVSLVGSQGKKTEIFLNELYGSLNWKFIEAYAGIKNREERYDGLSVINGDLLYSNNARSYPEFRIGSKDFVTLNFLKDIISFKASFANGIMLDKRYVNNTNVHHKNLFVKLGEYKGFSIIAGMDHYVQWGGKSPKWGNMGGFDAFIDAVFVQSGKLLVDEDGNSSVHESMNKAGNHLVQNSFQFNYSHPKFLINTYLRNITEDNSGDFMHLPDVHDWNFGLFVKFKKGKFISSVMYEHFYSKHQDDEIIRPWHKDEPVIGYDNYFNNGVYRSGWTSYGRTIGNPLFTANTENGGITLGVFNNALKAHHFGISGEISGIVYKAKTTFSKNYGRAHLTNDGGGNNPENFHRTYTIDPPNKQQSYSLELSLPKYKKLPFVINLGFAYDCGDHLSDNNFGCYVSLIRKGVF
jgi:hypothetical protein